MAEDTNQKGLQDPDYEDVSSSPRKSVLSDEQKMERLTNIINKEFSSEIERKEKDIDIIDERLLLAKKTLHRLRYAIVKSYYNPKQYQLTEEDIRKEIVNQKDPIARAKIHTLLRDEQKRIHPALKKLFGKKQDVDLDDLFKIRPPRKRNKLDSNAGPSTSENFTIPVDDSIENLRTHFKTEIKIEHVDDDEIVEPVNVKVPRYVEPKDMEKNVLEIDTAIRNKQKEKFRIIIGNTSKYTPSHSEMDRSTHRWLLYVRGPRDKPDISHFVQSVIIKLDNSYAPHNIIKLVSSPFHLSRRGWGEFTVNLRVHFKNERLNKPVNLVHDLKLDRNYTGLQTLGGETVVDVWLYPDETMIEKEQTHFDSASVHESIQPSNTECEHFSELRIKHEVEADPKVGDENAVDDMSTAITNPETVNNCINWENNVPFAKSFIKLEPMDISESNYENIVTSHKTNVSEQSDVLDVRINRGSVINGKLINKPTVFKSSDQLRSSLTISTNQKPKTLVKTHPNSLLKISGFPECEESSGTGNVEYSKKQIILRSYMSASIETILEDHCYVKEEHMLNIFLGIRIDPSKGLKSNDNSSVVYKTSNQSACHNKIMSHRNLNIGYCENESLNIVTSIINFFKRNIQKMDTIRSAVSIMLKKMPLVHNLADTDEYQMMFPYTVRDEEEFFKLHFIKRRNLEWTRAKMIKNFLKSYWLPSFRNEATCRLWSVKQIILFSHYHGYFPVKNSRQLENYCEDNMLDNNAFDRMMEIPSQQININDRFQSAAQINSLSNIHECRIENIVIKKEFPEDPSSLLDQNTLRNQLKIESDYKMNVSDDSDDEIDICSIEESGYKKKNNCNTEKKVSHSIVLPFSDHNEKLLCSYIEKICAKQGVELRNEDIANGYSDCLAHKTILSALKCLIEDILRRSLALKMASLNEIYTHSERNGSGTRNTNKHSMWGRSESGSPSIVTLRHVYEAINSRQEFDVLTNYGLGTLELDYAEKL